MDGYMSRAAGSGGANALARDVRVSTPLVLILRGGTSRHVNRPSCRAISWTHAVALRCLGLNTNEKEI
jgi:hypothetical protein